MNHDRFGNPVDENGHDILEDDDFDYDLIDEATDEELGFDDDHQPTEYEEWQDVYGGDDFFEPFDSDLGNEY